MRATEEQPASSNSQCTRPYEPASGILESYRLKPGGFLSKQQDPVPEEKIEGLSAPEEEVAPPPPSPACKIKVMIWALLALVASIIALYWVLLWMMTPSTHRSPVAHTELKKIDDPDQPTIDSIAKREIPPGTTTTLSWSQKPLATLTWFESQSWYEPLPGKGKRDQLGFADRKPDRHTPVIEAFNGRSVSNADGSASLVFSFRVRQSASTGIYDDRTLELIAEVAPEGDLQLPLKPGTYLLLARNGRWRTEQRVRVETPNPNGFPQPIKPEE